MVSELESKSKYAKLPSLSCCYHHFVHIHVYFFFFNTLITIFLAVHNITLDGPDNASAMDQSQTPPQPASHKQANQQTSPAPKPPPQNTPPPPTPTD